MSEEIQKLARDDPQNASKTKLFSILSYICLAACVACSIFGKWILAGAAGAGIILFSVLESRYEKRSVAGALAESLDVKEENR